MANAEAPTGWRPRKSCWRILRRFVPCMVSADNLGTVKEAAQPERLQLTPSGEGRAALEQDYAQMLEDGLLLDEAETFDERLSRCAKIQDKANASG
ncbi:hypothetical protein [Rhizobium sp. BR 314]|uniref:hypothetical protein n=1 Tax=Rhizobium sp. BR 314 TaxID=3040013 RepID=UPI0039BFD7DF